MSLEDVQDAHYLSARGKNKCMKLHEWGDFT